MQLSKRKYKGNKNFIEINESEIKHQNLWNITIVVPRGTFISNYTSYKTENNSNQHLSSHVKNQKEEQTEKKCIKHESRHNLQYSKNKEINKNQ